MPSTAVHDVQISPTSKSYNNGELSPPFTIASWDPQELVSSKDPDLFETFAMMRLGLGVGAGSNKDGVFWVGEGALYEAYTGKILAKFEGFDIGKGVRLSNNHMRQLSRKIFWFRDPSTGEIMEEFNGMPVKPIIYDSQMIDYHKDVDGSITYSVEASSRPLEDLPKSKITSRMAGPKQMMINVPVFIDIPISQDKRYQAWEFYDYSFDPTFPVDRPATAVWTRQGAVPPFIMDSKAVMKFTGYRVDSFDELPERMRLEVERAYPHFKEPPRDEEEVRETSNR